MKLFEKWKDKYMKDNYLCVTNFGGEEVKEPFAVEMSRAAFKAGMLAAVEIAEKNCDGGVMSGQEYCETLIRQAAED